MDFIIPVISIPSIDVILCLLFGNKSRWFQLHCAINGIITCIIWQDVFEIVYNPLISIKTLNTQMDAYFIIVLHIYHAIAFKQLSYMDYFHHILFVGTGVIPAILYYDFNLIKLAWFTACGLPGFIEYFSLSLVKHDKITSLTQKRVIAYVYNYIRFPIAVFGITVTYVIYKNYNNLDVDPNIINDLNGYLIIYFNLLLFFNGAFYNKLTIENYIVHKHRLVNNYYRL